MDYFYCTKCDQEIPSCIFDEHQADHDEEAAEEESCDGAAPSQGGE